MYFTMRNKKKKIDCKTRLQALREVYLQQKVLCLKLGGYSQKLLITKCKKGCPGWGKDS
jgi:hypothetical protein